MFFLFTLVYVALWEFSIKHSYLYIGICLLCKVDSFLYRDYTSMCLQWHLWHEFTTMYKNTLYIFFCDIIYLETDFRAKLMYTSSNVLFFLTIFFSFVLSCRNNEIFYIHSNSVIKATLTN